ncbi:hypothetical protein BH10ACI1_BH10ACI1_24200 [soil metagenome]
MGMLFLAAIFVLIGFGMVGGSIGFGFRRRSFLSKAAEAMGTVVNIGEAVSRNFDHNRIQNGIQFGTRRETWFRPTVRFQTADGKTIDYTPTVATKTRFTVGQQIAVNYDPHNPQSVTLGSRKSFLMWLPFIFVGFIGAFFSLFGLIFGLIAVAGF